MGEKNFNWRLYFLLLVAGILSVIAVLPYVLTIQGEILRELPLPLPLILLLSVIQSSVLIGVLLFVGLKLSKKVGLRLPILENYFASGKINLKPILIPSIIFGGIAGAIIILLDFFFTYMGINLMGAISAPIWQGFLASFYGGIGEEILLRLFFMTFVVWLVSKLIQTKGNTTDNNFIMWLSIIIAAVLFGVAHLPATAALTYLTPLVIFRALLLNGVGGLVFGWLYWKKGFESAMIAHFSADIMLHVLFPLIFL